MLARLAESVAGAHSLESLARPLLVLLQEITKMESVYLTQVDENSCEQRILFANNVGALQIGEGLTVPWSDTLCRRALASGQRFADDVPELWPDSGAARELGIRSYLTQPVVLAEGRFFGTLCGASSEVVTYTPAQERLVKLFARLLGQQVEREALVRQMRQAQDELLAHAMTDPLTGLANRRMLLDGLQSELSRIAREGGELHLAFVDLDDFKAINDRFGHQLGDRFLAEIAARLRDGLRGSDMIARYGGDEFVVVVRGGRTGGPDSLQHRIESLTRCSLTLDDVHVDYRGASVGVVTTQDGREAPQTLISRADESMYRRKEARRAPEGLASAAL
ncbi:MAG: sensor domain-containing diguanylate cyclase [Xanthomonadales bacterium]|nr:sensor domain-containing diguanylate cyclase [Xanthomonadales bacterium]